MFNLLAMLTCGPVISFVMGWTMALAIFAAFPIFGLIIVLFAYLLQKKETTFDEEYSKGDVLCHQALNAIKTVKSMNGQKYEAERYSRSLEPLREKIQKIAFIGGVGIGLLYFISVFLFPTKFVF